VCKSRRKDRGKCCGKRCEEPSGSKKGSMGGTDEKGRGEEELWLKEIKKKKG